MLGADGNVGKQEHFLSVFETRHQIPNTVNRKQNERKGKVAPFRKQKRNDSSILRCKTEWVKKKKVSFKENIL